MKFQFHLQKVVDLKSSEKEQAEWMLSAALSRMKLEEQTLDELRESRRTVECMVGERAASSTSAAELAMLTHYLHHIDSLIEQRQAILLQAKQEVAAKSEHLVSKMKDEKIWLNVRERSFTAYQTEQIRREQNVLDEMATARYSKS